MSLKIWFEEDVTGRLFSLHQANEHSLQLAQKYGMNVEVAELCREVYAGALADVAVSFGVAPMMLVRQRPKDQGTVARIS